MPRSIQATICAAALFFSTISAMGQNSFGTAPASPAGPARSFAPDPMAVPRAKPTGLFNIQLKDGSNVIGKVSDKTPLKLKSALGAVEIPLTKLASIQFSGDKSKTQVLLRNNDRVTGELLLDKISIETDWAELTLGANHIQSMTSKELGKGQAVIRHAVTETLPDGSHRVRYIERVVPAGSSTPGWSPGATTYPTPAGYPSPYAPSYSTPPTVVPPARAVPLPAPSLPVPLEKPTYD